MAVAKIKKINIVSHKNYKKQILEFLYSRGFIEIIPPGTEEKENLKKTAGASIGLGHIPQDEFNTDYRLAKVKAALDFLNIHHKDERSFLDKLNFEKEKISFSKIDKLRVEFDYLKAAKKAESIMRKINSSKSMIQKLKDEQRMLEPWRGLPIITGSDLKTIHTKVLLGETGKDKYETMRAELIDKYCEIEIKKINENAISVYLMLIFLKKDEKNIISTLTDAEFKLIELPALTNVPNKRMEEVDIAIMEEEKDIVNMEAGAGVLAKRDIKNLKFIYDFLTWKQKQEQAQENFVFTDSSFMVTGWIKNSEYVKMERGLREITENYEIIEMEIAPDEDVPIVMENRGFIRPFEFVTNIYGFPKYNEVDPTPFLAGFFVIFFGLCLTDAGYGLTLVIVSFLALKFLKVDQGFTKLLKVLFIGGIITFVDGGLTGGWFGIALDDLAFSSGWAWFAKPLLFIRQIDPVKDPITMLVFSIILGYIHLIFGNAINLWWKIKHGEFKEGFRTSGVWMYFLLTVGLWIVASQGIFMAAFAGLAKYMAISSLILIVATQGKGKSLVVRIFGGLGELYFGLSGYISDILSYSRLLALGLATGIIGMVVNIVAMMLNDMIPYVGWIFMILMLVGGHLLNMAISLVGAFIHSGRLQYVEFFKTFFDGGGKEFAPFVRESKFVTVVED